MYAPHPEVERFAAYLQRHEPLPRDELDTIEGISRSIHAFHAGQHLLREGDRPGHCSFLVRGFVYRHKVVGSGGRQIVAIHLPGDLIDVQQMLLAHADHSVQALTAGELMAIPCERLKALVADCPGIGTALFRKMLVEASIMREWLVNTNRRDARARLAHLLCELAFAARPPDWAHAARSCCR